MTPPLTTLTTSTQEKCHFCGFDEIDPIKYGPMYKLEDIVAHYYCILLSHKMEQRGKDEQGILGFLLPDIRNELKRASKITCSYCDKSRASLQCAKKNCKLKFHLPCGLNNGSLHQFMKQFLSFCVGHRPVQDIPLKAIQEAKQHQPICLICQDPVDYTSKTDAIWAPCCSKTWYHRFCVQQLANSAGYFFKCANCNNNERFRNWVLKYGIFIPEQDASWELEPNAFNDLLTRYSHCDAEECTCPSGRDADAETTRWEIILCNSCGSQGIHIACGRLKFSNPIWECPLCKKVTSATENRERIASDSPPTENSPESSSTTEDENFRILRMGRRKSRRSRSLDHRSNYESSSSLTEQTFSRHDRKRKSEPRRKRRRKAVEDEGSEDSTKKPRHDYPIRRRGIGDENLKPDTGSELKDSKCYPTRTKGRAESTSSSSSESDKNPAPKESSSGLEKEGARKKKKSSKRTPSDNLSEVIKNVKPGPLSWKLGEVKKKLGAADLEDDDIMELPKPPKKHVLVDLGDSSDDERKEESEEEIIIEDCNLSQQDIMYRVKKEVVEESDEDIIEVADLSPTSSEKKNSEDESAGEVLDNNLLNEMYDGSKFKIVEESLNAPIIVIKTEKEKENDEDEHVNIETEDESEPEREPEKEKEKTPEVEVKEKGEATIKTEVRKIVKEKSISPNVSEKEPAKIQKPKEKELEKSEKAQERVEDKSDDEIPLTLEYKGQIYKIEPGDNNEPRLVKWSKGAKAEQEKPAETKVKPPSAPASEPTSCTPSAMPPPIPVAVPPPVPVIAAAPPPQTSCIPSNPSFVPPVPSSYTSHIPSNNPSCILSVPTSRASSASAVPHQSQYQQNYYQPQRHITYHRPYSNSTTTNPIPSTLYTQTTPTPTVTSSSTSWTQQLRPRTANDPRTSNQYGNAFLSNFEVVGSIDPINSQYGSVPQPATENPPVNISSQPQTPQYPATSQQYTYSVASQHPYGASQQPQYTPATSLQPRCSPSTTQLPRYPVQPRHTSPASQQYPMSPQRLRLSTASYQPQHSVASYQPQHSAASYQPQYSAAPQSSTSSQQPQYFQTSQQSQYLPSSSRPETVSQPETAGPIIVEVSTLSNADYEAAAATPNVSSNVNVYLKRSPNKSPCQRKPTPPDKNTPRKPNFINRAPGTPPRMPAIRQRPPPPPYRMQQPNVKPVAAIKPSPPIPVKRKSNEESDDIEVIEVQKPPPLANLPPAARNRARAASIKKDVVADVIEID